MRDSFKGTIDPPKKVKAEQPAEVKPAAAAKPKPAPEPRCHAGPHPRIRTTRAQATTRRRPERARDDAGPVPARLNDLSHGGVATDVSRGGC